MRIKSKEERGILGLERDEFFDLVHYGMLREHDPEPGHHAPTYEQEDVESLAAHLAEARHFKDETAERAPISFTNVAPNPPTPHRSSAPGNRDDSLAAKKHSATNIV